MSSFVQPDITAPGVDVLASFSEAVPISESKYNTRRWPFNLLSGTSMACPHVAGIMALLRKQYPHWSPAAIRSAIMTTGISDTISILPTVFCREKDYLTLNSDCIKRPKNFYIPSIEKIKTIIAKLLNGKFITPSTQ